MKKILVVEDEPRLKDIICRQLKEEHYTPVWAENGERALEILGSDTDIELVVLDILLPKYNGLEIFDVVRTEYPWIHIIISSVYKPEEQAFLISKADGYYYKVSPIVNLIEIIKKLEHVCVD